MSNFEQGQSRVKDSFNFSKLKGNRMKGSIDYKHLNHEMKRGEVKHRDVNFDQNFSNSENEIFDEFQYSKLSEYKKNYFESSSKDVLAKSRDFKKDHHKDGKNTLKKVLRKSNPPLPNNLKEKFSNGHSKLVRDRSSLMEKYEKRGSKSRSGNKRDLSSKREHNLHSNMMNSSSKDEKKILKSGKSQGKYSKNYQYKSIDQSRAQADRQRRKKQNDMMKSYSGISGRSNSIEGPKKGSKERRKKIKSNLSGKEYGSSCTGTKFKSSSNYINKSFLRSGSNVQGDRMLKISDKIRSFRAQYNSGSGNIANQ